MSKKRCSGKPTADVKIQDHKHSSISEQDSDLCNVIDTGDQLLTELKAAHQNAPCSMDMTVNDDTSCSDDLSENMTAIEDMSILLDNNNTDSQVIAIFQLCIEDQLFLSSIML